MAEDVRLDDVAGRVIAFEMGALPEDEIVNLFQDLINSGIVWSLQGSYGRTAIALIENGLCTDPRS
jgi:hypothetical protein